MQSTVYFENLILHTKADAITFVWNLKYDINELICEIATD